jgi:hypothetical protein
VRSSSALASFVAFALAGCGEVSERASINARLTEGEGMLAGVEVSSSAGGAELEVDWSVVLTSFGEQPCTVAVYRWLDELPAEGELPAVATSEDWPQSWDGGELIDRVTVPPGEAVMLGPTRLDDARDLRVGGVLGFATCTSSVIDAVVIVEAAADLGVRAAYDALVIDLWRAG